VAEAFSLPEQAGGSTVMLTGDDLVDCILTYARQGNITIREDGRTAEPLCW
jgi:two-component system sensor histidine kinase KdpD